MIIYIILGAGLMGTISGVICIILYKRQVVSICRQIRFLNKEESNLLVTSDLGAKEFSELISEINNMILKSRDNRNIVEKKDRELKETITNISHDIRTPLTSLNGYFELLQSTENEEEREKYCVIIKERINSLKDMLEQLFTYVKLQNGDYTFELEKLDINTEITKVLVSFYEEFRKYGIKPVINIPEESMVKDLNQVAFRRIFENIIKNSLEHGRNYFEFNLENDNERIIFTIKNDINKNYNLELDKVFNRFYKADVSRSQSSSGLGLAVAHDMVEKMNGTISAELDRDLFVIKVIF